MKRTNAIKQILLITIIAILFLIPTIVKANETFTTPEGIVATKIVNNSAGNVEFKITNLNISEEGSYKWAISKTKTEPVEEEWFVLTDINAADKTANVSVNPGDRKLKELLRTTNTAYLYIKDLGQNKNLIDGLKVDLTIPPIYAYNIAKQYTFYWRVENAYGIKNIMFKFEKINDEKIINEFNNKNGKIDEMTILPNMSSEPKSGWKEPLWNGREPSIEEKDRPKEAGLYCLWIKGKDADSKVLIGYDLIKIGEEKPRVTSIEVSSPSSGTYKEGQTVKINVHFNEKITGTTAPTLKIRFGESPERTVTTATIKGNYSYIEYLYNIQKGDIGQIATVSLTGGTIKNTKGIDAEITCPIISGNVIKANTNGIITNETENQDKHNDNKNENTENNIENNNNTNNTNNNGKKEEGKTTITKLPFAGKSIAIVLLIASIVGISLLSYKKFNNLKGI